MPARNTKLSMSEIYSQNLPVAVEAEQAPAMPIEKRPAAPKKSPRQQVNFYADPKAYERFKKAHRSTLAYTDYDSLSAHLNHMLEQEAQRLEDQYNEGRPFGF